MLLLKLLLMMMKLQLMLLEMGITHNQQVFGITRDARENTVISSSSDKSVCTIFWRHDLLRGVVVVVVVDAG